MPLWRRASRGQVQLQVKQTRQWRHAEYEGLQLLTTGQSQGLLEAQRIGSEKICTKSRVVQARASGHICDLGRISELGNSHNETPNPQTGAQLTNVPTETPHLPTETGRVSRGTRQKPLTTTSCYQTTSKAINLWLPWKREVWKGRFKGEYRADCRMAEA